MAGFLLKRIFSGILSLILIVVLVSGIIFLSPVDPATLSFGQQMNDEMLEQKRQELALDKPIYLQIMYYLNDLSPFSMYSQSFQYENHFKPFVRINAQDNALFLKGPYLRESFQTGEKVSKMIKRALPNTLILALAAITIASILGLILGMIGALNKDSWLDGFIVGFSTIGYSVPSYVSAILFSLIFGFALRDWTHLNMQGSLITLNDIGDEIVVWKNLLLPALALGLRPVAVITQITRNAMLDTMSQPYILTARAKGMKLMGTIRKHIFRNMMNPVITTISGWFASLLAGAFFVESIFNYNGMGLLTVNALINYDIPLLLGCIVVIATIFILLNILVDLSYGWLDPKVRISA